MQAAKRGTELHDLAHQMIRLGVRARADKKTFSLYVNDAIGFRMTPEQILYYSENAYGTCDTISFRRGKLKIFDLKTGFIPAHVEQLEIYAALFCLEYLIKPFEIEIEMRIYQDDEVKIFEADPDVITHIMDRIVTFDKIISQIKSESA